MYTRRNGKVNIISYIRTIDAFTFGKYDFQIDGPRNSWKRRRVLSRLEVTTERSAGRLTLKLQSYVACKYVRAGQTTYMLSIVQKECNTILLHLPINT